MYKSVLASGGGVEPTGNAQPADVLSGKTFSNASGIDKTGTMPNNGAVSATVEAGQSYTIPAGYHNGSGTITSTAPTIVSPCEINIMGSGANGATEVSPEFIKMWNTITVSSGTGLFDCYTSGGTLQRHSLTAGTNYNISDFVTADIARVDLLGPITYILTT